MYLSQIAAYYEQQTLIMEQTKEQIGKNKCITQNQFDPVSGGCVPQEDEDGLAVLRLEPEGQVFSLTDAVSRVVERQLLRSVKMDGRSS